jgi:hypothetical protein
MGGSEIHPNVTETRRVRVPTANRTLAIGVERCVQISVGLAAKSVLHFAAISTWVVVIINHKV